MSIEITDNSKEVSAAIEAAILRGLEKCGLVADHAQQYRDILVNELKNG